MQQLAARMAMSECPVIPPYAIEDLSWHRRRVAEVPHDAHLLCRHCLCSWPGKKMSDVHQLWRGQLGAEKGGPCMLGEGGNWRDSVSIHRDNPGTREWKGIFHTFLLAPQYILAGLWQFTWGVTSLGPGKKNAEKKEVSPGTQALAAGTTAWLERY